MASRFDSFAGGLARGLGTGLQLGQRSKELEFAKEQARADKFRTAIGAAFQSSQDAVDQASELAAQLAEQGASPEQIDSIAQVAKANAASYAVTVSQIIEQARLDGATPEQIEEIKLGLGDPAAFVEQQLARFDAAVEVGRLTFENQPPEQGSTFFATVTGDDGIARQSRVQSVRDDDGNFQFSVDGQPVDGSQLSTPINQQQSTTGELQIPGLTAGDSSKTIQELTEQGAAGNAYAALANEAAQLIADDPTKIGTVGDAIRFFGQLGAQAEAVARVVGLESMFVDENGQSITGDQAIEGFDFGSLREATADIKRTLLDLVFLDLAAKGQTGRAVSDRDLAIFMENTGINSGDPKQVIAGLNAGVRNNQILYRQNVLGRTRGTLTAEQVIGGPMVNFEQPGDRSSALRAVDEALAAGDFDRAEQLMDAIESNDTEAMQRLLNAAGQ